MGNRWYEGGVKVKKRFNNVYQFKITLRDIKPPIWRRIQVPETYTFWDLHVAIQDAMGWTDSH
ncbi:MAG TPA: plasmid pRiA4b ORF-3 family protein, partial [Thermosynergistes sp.]|nr:plasmid pRiA4b ORF-3 family protein [Thermosynergistes sp.]